MIGCFDVIECGKHFVKRCSVHGQINGSTIGIDPACHVSHRFIKTAANEQDRVTHGLGFQSATILAPQQTIFGIAFLILGIRLAVHLIHGRQHDRPVHRLQRPAIFHQRLRQPVEKFRVRRRLGLQPPVGRRFHQRLAKMPHPDSIHQHAGRQGILTSDQNSRRPLAVAEISGAAATLVRMVGIPRGIFSGPGFRWLPRK